MRPVHSLSSPVLVALMKKRLSMGYLDTRGGVERVHNRGGGGSWGAGGGDLQLRRGESFGGGRDGRGGRQDGMQSSQGSEARVGDMHRALPGSATLANMQPGTTQASGQRRRQLSTIREGLLQVNTLCLSLRNVSMLNSFSNRAYPSI